MVAKIEFKYFSDIQHDFLCTRLTAASDKVYQLLAHGWWFSPGTRLLPPLKLVAMI
jgi:hypothetical protein